MFAYLFIHIDLIEYARINVNIKIDSIHGRMHTLNDDYYSYSYCEVIVHKFKASKLLSILWIYWRLKS